MDRIKELIEMKEKEIKTFEDTEKMEVVKQLMQQENIFFCISTETAIGILEFLGVGEDEMLSLYYDLISPENYKKVMPTERFLVDNGPKK